MAGLWELRRSITTPNERKVSAFSEVLKAECAHRGTRLCYPFTVLGQRIQRMDQF